MNCMWDVLFSCILCFIEPNWSWQLTQIVMGVHSTWTCKSCSGLINIFKDTLFTSVRCFQLCLCPACSSSPLPPNLLFVVCPQHRYFLYFFEPIPSFLCVHVNVEMTSIVELFSDHFSFSVKSGMWTDQSCPFRAVACAACVLLIITFTQSQIQTF